MRLLLYLFNTSGFSAEEGVGSFKSLKIIILEDAQVIRKKSVCSFAHHPREAAVYIALSWVSRVKNFPFSTVSISDSSALQEELAALSASSLMEPKQNKKQQHYACHGNAILLLCFMGIQQPVH